MRRAHAPRTTYWLAVLVAASLAGACNRGVHVEVREQQGDGSPGRGVAGARVEVRGEEAEIDLRAVTGADGRLDLTLPRGRYRLTVHHPLFRPHEPDGGSRFEVGHLSLDEVYVLLEPREGTVVFLARHAEKATADANTSLVTGVAGQGVGRAAALARLLEDAPLAEVYATEWCRTAQTADPAARARGLTIRYQTFDRPEAGLGAAACEPDLASPVEPLPPAVADEASYAAEVLARGAGTASLVVGHSNTVPALVEALGAPSLCPGTLPLDAEGRCWLPDDQYGNLFVVTVGASGAATVESFVF